MVFLCTIKVNNPITYIIRLSFLLYANVLPFHSTDFEYNSNGIMIERYAIIRKIDPIGLSKV